MDLWILALGIVFFLGVLTLYVLHGEHEEHPYYPLHAKDTSGNSVTIQEPHQPNHAKEVVFVEDRIMKPYAKEPINDVDDYEYSMVFKNEGDRAMTKETRNLLMSQYPMDWSIQPPSSAKFQQGLTAFKEAFENAQMSSEPTVNIYSTVDGSNMIPPEEVKEVLATYVPKKPQNLTTYDIDDTKQLIEKIYAAKGLKANYKQTGKNQFTVMSVSPLGEKVKYEDEYVPASSEAVKTAGEETIVVPSAASNGGNPIDPFFTPGETTRDRPWDYTRWTPGLERMFAPTEPRAAWF